MDHQASSNEHSIQGLITAFSSAVHNLIYWRDPTKSGIFLFTSICLIVALRFWSTLAVASLTLMILMVLSGLYKFASVLLISVVGKSLPALPSVLSNRWKIMDSSSRTVEQLIDQADFLLQWIQSIILWEQVIQSILVLAFVFLSFHVGRMFDTLTILLMQLIFTFTVPYLYARNQHHIEKSLKQIKQYAVSAKDKLTQKLNRQAASTNQQEDTIDSTIVDRLKSD